MKDLLDHQSVWNKGCVILHWKFLSMILTVFQQIFKQFLGRALSRLQYFLHKLQLQNQVKLTYVYCSHLPWICYLHQLKQSHINLHYQPYSRCVLYEGLWVWSYPMCLFRYILSLLLILEYSLLLSMLYINFWILFPNSFHIELFI